MRKMYVLLMAAAFGLAVPTAALSQLTIQGKVTDEAGEPLPGAILTVVGTSYRTTANSDGTFRLTVPSAPPEIKVRSELGGFREVIKDVFRSSGTVVLNFVLARSAEREDSSARRARSELPTRASRPPESRRASDRPPYRLPPPAQPRAEPPPAPTAEDQPVPRPQPAPQARPLSLVDSVLSALERASIAFNAPSTINVNDNAIIELLLSAQSSTRELIHVIEAQGDVDTATVRIANRMEARLTGGGFRITAITPEEQAVTLSEPTGWKWEVSPTEAGHHKLHLTLTALLSVDDQTSRRAIRTFDTDIDVEVTLVQRTSMFVNENWQWLFTVLVIPVAGWLWKSRNRKQGRKRRG